ncbi:MAG: excinuclease ABC subunit UvrA [Akkermansiaceae bacterium]|nr:excinuclease ABC subunit UvrA [Akkermansiaceae bacterium]
MAIHNARQNNLKGLDLEIPLGRLTVVTGPSGSGKSSLAFQTLYAEGQRRYVETFSPYVRQFFDRMDKPAVDRIDGIPPAIAIEQKNNVRTTRSTVGTITEINDYLKILYARHAHAVDPHSGEIIRPDHPDSIAAWCLEHAADSQAMVLFPIPAPDDADPAEFFAFLQQQGYLRILLDDTVVRTDEPPAPAKNGLPPQVMVIQDRLKISSRNRQRLLEALERALHLGKGHCSVAPTEGPARAFSSTWSNPKTGFTARPPTPALFTFNNPLGACPACRGFGRVIGIDLAKAVPDPYLSIKGGAVKPFQGERGAECQRDLVRFAKERGLDPKTPYADLTEEEQRWILYGERDDPEDAWSNDEWYGVNGFFVWLEAKSYKMHVRIFLARYRSYTTCGECRGRRLQPEALVYHIDEKTLPDLWLLSVTDLRKWFDSLQARIDGQAAQNDKTTQLVLGEITSRLRYLCEVGLGYLTLDRPTRTLSGGEVERVNLTTCLGASLTNTLFVLDEPTVGLHPRDIDALVGVMHGLRDKGNTLVVVEHEETVMRAADHILDIGPGSGEHGGEIVAAVSGHEVRKGRDSKAHPESLTLQFLRGTKSIPVPASRRKPLQFITIKNAHRHNIRNLDAKVPLGVFCAVTGVSGSGKSTFVHDILYRNLARQMRLPSDEEAAPVKSIDGAAFLSDVRIVDQTPLARTPRSTPVVYLGAFDLIRQLFAGSPDGELAGVKPGFFSFNSGAGRCERCWGNGFEKVEMQFLSDLYLTCPECGGSRYSQAALQVRYEDKTIADVLGFTVTEAIEFFSAGSAATARRAATKAAGQKLRIVETLRPLNDLGLGYLRLGQPLNTLSGGEAQRLKLCTILIETARDTGSSSLLILDEPTTGLHFGDIERLLGVFQRLVDAGHSLLVIEHNLDVIKSADYLLDLGPGPGADGGRIVAIGTPEEVAATKTETARFLGPVLRGCGPAAAGPAVPAATRRGSKKNATKVAEAKAQYRTSNIEPRNGNAISIFGAREHNLKNIDLSIPRDEFVVVTGLSGSGKSTLAFDIIFAEGQRRFLDSMSPYARQFAEQLEKPDVDRISGLPPTVAIEQRISRGGGKSTVATVTEVYHFLRLLYAKLGTQYCPESGAAVVPQTEDAIVATIRKHLKRGPASVLAPVIRGRKGFHTEVAAWADRQGFTKLYVDGGWKDVDGFERLARFKEHDIDVHIQRFGKTGSADEIRAAVTTALRIGKGTLRLLDHANKLHVFSKARVSPATGRSFEPLDPSHFSYNSPRGWCPSCRGYGQIAKVKRKRFDSRRNTPHNSVSEAEIEFDRKLDRADKDELVLCPECEGARLNEVSRAVRIGGHAIHDLARLPVTEAAAIVAGFAFDGREATIARDILPEIAQRLGFLDEVGLSYLQLDRSAKTLSGGEAQRIRLAAQLGSNLRGVLYVLDEPTIGLHPRDNAKLLDTLAALKDKGNSLLVVEHDDDTMSRAGHIIDLGPAAGRHGGEVVASGSFKQIQRLKNSVTGQAIRHPLHHPVRGERRSLPKPAAKSGWLRLRGCHLNNLKDIDVRIPARRLTVITGISGCGKSSLMRGTVAAVLKNSAGPAGARKAQSKSRKPKPRSNDVPCQSTSGFGDLKACYEVDQSPIGKTSRSCPATYVKIFDQIRKLFAQVPEARMRGFDASRFSFNNEPGRCPECRGNGRIKLEMDFLPATWTHCDACNGKRYNPATLEILYNGMSIGEVLEMTIEEAVDFFEAHPKLHHTLSLLADTGLGYLQLGQPSPTLSGGEAQRLKLVTELTKGRNPKTTIRNPAAAAKNLYLIEEPSIGLHLEDVKRLIDVLHRLVDEGHTVVVIEHHTGIMAEADYIIDMGPEAGAMGGAIVVQGPPEQVAKSRTSRTAPFLRKALEA